MNSEFIRFSGVQRRTQGVLVQGNQQGNQQGKMTNYERQYGKGEHLFLVFFLYDDRDLSVRVEEAETIDLREVTEHLDLGGSVFLTHRRNPETARHKRSDRALPKRGAPN